MYKLDKNKNYLIACSGGPDSMALLDMCYKLNLNIIVGHVNYHHRDTALRDQIIVEDYCKKNNLKFFVKDYQDSKKGNFQKLARVFRYHFFSDLMKENNIDYLLTAHQLDDLIETYLFQLKRKMIPDYYGIKQINNIYNLNVIRPLLVCSKVQLLNYCIDNNINYGIDESNLSDDYARNKIRHSIVEKMSGDDKKELIKEINSKNENKKKQILSIKEYLDKEYITVDEFCLIDNKVLFINEKLKYKLGIKQLNDLINQLINTEKLLYKVKNQYVVREYGLIKIIDIPKPFNYKLYEIEGFECERFKIANSGVNIQRFAINDEDLPIVIRNYQDGDKIKMSFGHKKVNRFFIDNKISYENRMNWLVIENVNKEIIFVSGIGSNLTHFKGNQVYFVIE